MYKLGLKMVTIDALSHYLNYKELYIMVTTTKHLYIMTFINFMIAYKENRSLFKEEHIHFVKEIYTKAKDFILEDGVLYY